MSDRHALDAVMRLADPTEVGNLDTDAFSWLLRQDIGTGAVAGPWAVRAGRVVFDADADLYLPNPIGKFALIVGVLDEPWTGADLNAIDLIAWSPKSGHIGTRLGNALALGEEQIGVNGFGTTGKPIPVHRTPLGWLRAGRRGIVIADWRAASLALSGLILGAEDGQHRQELLHRLTAAPPTIVIPRLRAA